MIWNGMGVRAVGETRHYISTKSPPPTKARRSVGPGTNVLHVWLGQNTPEKNRGTGVHSFNSRYERWSMATGKCVKLVETLPIYLKDAWGWAHDWSKWT